MAHTDPGTEEIAFQLETDPALRRHRLAQRAGTGGWTKMTFSEMFGEQDARTFQERRDEVVAIVSSATNLDGADKDLRPFVEQMCVAVDEREFDSAFDLLVSSISTTAPLHAPARRQPSRRRIINV